jgi:hypothetical protein
MTNEFTKALEQLEKIENKMSDSSTIKSIAALQNTVDALKVKGIDPLFIFAALTQVQSNLAVEDETDLLN